MKYARTGTALILLFSLPLAAFGQSRPGGGSRPAPAARPAPPAQRPNPPAQRPNPPAQRPNPPAQRPNPPAQRPNQPAQRPPSSYYRPPNYRPSHTVVVVNPIYRGPAWGWNRGVAWYPAPAYWGGGFWGTLGYIYGQNNQQYVSYQVQPNSPGAQMLMNYQLTQTQCGPDNLVVIYGPNNSVICAYPNNLVSAGTYSLDPSTLTLSSY